jgi:predicted DsbA family dithiol-disulfide isomerase
MKSAGKRTSSVPRWYARLVRVDIWSDLVCPWCYVGKRRFERALSDFPHRDAVEVVYHSFQLDPASPRGSSSPRRAALKAKYGWSDAQADAMDARMTRTAAAEGLEYHLDGGVTGNTFDAHQVLHLARERGIQDAVAERLFRAHFTELRSIFDRQSLIELAVEAGLDRRDVQDALARDAYAGAVKADVEQARALGASGVPFFVVANRYGVSGAQAAEVLTGTLTRAWSELRAGGDG